MMNKIHTTFCVKFEVTLHLPHLNSYGEKHKQKASKNTCKEAAAL